MGLDINYTKSKIGPAIRELAVSDLPIQHRLRKALSKANEAQAMPLPDGEFMDYWNRIFAVTPEPKPIPENATEDEMMEIAGENYRAFEKAVLALSDEECVRVADDLWNLYGLLGIMTMATK